MQRLRVRYAKRGRLRFTSHRDVARAMERGVRRAGLPIAFSAGFSPHPKISYAGAAPTGVASEAEYLEIGLAEPRDPDEVRAALDAALPAGLDVLAVVDAATSQAKALADRLTASHWRVELPEVDPARAQAAVDLLLAASSAPVQRATKDGTRTVDVRAALLVARVADARCATLEMVVQHVTPAVRPDDIVTALRSIGGLTTPVAPVATRLAQGLIDEASPEDAERLLDPLG